MNCLALSKRECFCAENGEVLRDGQSWWCWRAESSLVDDNGLNLSWDVLGFHCYLYKRPQVSIWVPYCQNAKIKCTEFPLCLLLLSCSYILSDLSWTRLCKILWGRQDNTLVLIVLSSICSCKEIIAEHYTNSLSLPWWKKQSKAAGISANSGKGNIIC